MSNIKQKFAGQNIRQVTTGQIVEKPWGKEEMEYINGDLMVKKLTMFKGKMCSIQLHEIKREVATVLFGQLSYITLKKEILNVPENERTMQVVEQMIEKSLILNPGEMVVVEPSTIHYMSAPNKEAVYREVSFGPNETLRVFDPNAHLRSGDDLTK